METKIKRAGIGKYIKAWYNNPKGPFLYDYPIVYADGYISRIISDSKDRIPYGILIGRWIVSLLEPEKMCYHEAAKYCSGLRFISKKGSLPSIYLLRKIKRNFEKINLLIERIGYASSKISCDYYLSSAKDTEYEGCYITIRMNESDVVLEFAAEPQEKACIRPVFHL